MFWVLYWHHAVRSAHAMLAHACASHFENLDNDEKLCYNDVLYWGTMGEFIGHLQSSKSLRARNLANWLRIRRLFKRGISLNYEDDKQLYGMLLKKKIECEKKGDKLLLQLSSDIAEQINQTNAGKGSTIRLSRDDIIVDIPREDKDKLGKIYVVEKGADVVTPYQSRGLIGNFDDWQNRVRTVRIFIDPRVDEATRSKIAHQGRAILETIT